MIRRLVEIINPAAVLVALPFGIDAPRALVAAGAALAITVAWRLSGWGAATAAYRAGRLAGTRETIARYQATMDELETALADLEKRTGTGAVANAIGESAFEVLPTEDKEGFVGVRN